MPSTDTRERGLAPNADGEDELTLALWRAFGWACFAEDTPDRQRALLALQARDRLVAANRAALRSPAEHGEGEERIEIDPQARICGTARGSEHTVHATHDGVRTLCGREVHWWESKEWYEPNSAYACKRCNASIRSKVPLASSPAPVEGTKLEHHLECGPGFPEPGCHRDCPHLRRCREILAAPGGGATPEPSGRRHVCVKCRREVPEEEGSWPVYRDGEARPDLTGQVGPDGFLCYDCMDAPAPVTGERERCPECGDDWCPDELNAACENAFHGPRQEMCGCVRRPGRWGTHLVSACPEHQAMLPAALPVQGERERPGGWPAILDLPEMSDIPLPCARCGEAVCECEQKGRDAVLAPPADSSQLSTPAPAPQPEERRSGRACGCLRCRAARLGAVGVLSDLEMVVCSRCGNKRCPHASNHRMACTGSNEPGQVGVPEEREAIARDFEQYVEIVRGVFDRAVQEAVAVLNGDIVDNPVEQLRASIAADVTRRLDGIESKILSALRGTPATPTPEER